MNVYLILCESGAIQTGQDIRETELFRRSLRLGLISNQPPEQAMNSAGSAAPGEELLLHVNGMWCTSCAWLIEHALRSLPGVVQAEAAFATDLVKVRYRPQDLPPDRIIGRITALGYGAERFTADSETADAERRDLLVRTGLAAFLWANVMSFSLVLYAGYFEQISGSVRRGLPFVLMAMATPVVFYCAQPVLRLAWRGLLNRAIRMELLLAIGILAAYGYSVAQAFRGEIHLYFDTATIIVTLVLAGKLIERGAKERVTQWIAALHRMMPNKARLLAKGEERFVSVQALEPGQVFVVKAGEHIPADGLVIDGDSHADESLLTGEATPVGKHRADTVAAGSVNLDGVLHVQAIRSAGDSTLSRIIKQVEQALGSRSNLERTVDRVSRVFVPCVVLIAILTFLFTWLAGSANLGQAIMRGITVLVIACPCALGLATPLTITAAFGAACRRGILVRDSRVLEAVRRIDTVILDKTGTVTEGRFSLIDLVSCERPQAEVVLAGGQDGSSVEAFSSLNVDPIENDQVLSLLASLEQYSEHPLGQAVTELARAHRCALHDATSVEIRKGHGITAIVTAKLVFAGNRRFITELGIQIDPDTERQALESETDGKTVSFVGWDGEVRALAIFGDRVKAEAVSLAAELRRRGIDVRLISGDAPATTRWAASALGIESFESEILPDQKADVVRRLQESGAVVAMVGDGINDAPALAQADLGIAMASGTDVAMKAAAVTLMNGSLLKVLDVFDLSSQTMRVVRQNLFWAFFYNSVGISLAVVGILNPIMAAAAMLLSSASVVANSLRLVRRVG
jgi:heavy metal translocating P-type ATPase